jgi:hypothetical protein
MSVETQESSNQDLNDDLLTFWRTVENPDPDFIKKVTFGRSFTAIDATYQLREATRKWGQCGDKWGLRNIRWETMSIPAFDSQGHPCSPNVNVILHCELFYPADSGHEGVIEQVVDLPFKSGQDTFKKLKTAARSKALSELGFGANVYLGKYDDQAFVTQEKERHERSEALMQKAIESLMDATDMDELDRVQERIVAFMNEGKIVDEDGADLLRKVNNQRKLLATKKS